jgi:phage gp46-like protein
MLFPEGNTVTVNGVAVDMGTANADPLVRAVLLSLFTWRRAEIDDVQPGESRMGWCGDTLAPVSGDRFGSRLWLLARENVTTKTMQRAREYALEALQWFIDDGAATAIDVTAERFGRNGIALRVVLYREGNQVLKDLRFSDIWSAINGT